VIDEKNPWLLQFGHAHARATHLTAACLVLSVVCLGLVGIDVSVVKGSRDLRPLVIRVDELGRAQAFRFAEVEGSANAKDVQVYLARFCELYYGRSQYTLATDLPDSLYFLDSLLARGAKLQWDKDAKASQDLATIQVDVLGVIIRSMPSATALGEAEVDFREHIKDSAGAREEMDTARMTFSVVGKPPVGGELINPWGVTISTLETMKDYQAQQTATATASN
jgi:type IV secretory pathway TrbF-like protein